MTFDIITIFPSIFDSYFRESIIKRAQQEDLIKINIHNLRLYTTDKHKTVDDKPFGGGAGMIVKLEPIFKAVTALKKLKVKSEKLKVVLLSAKGKKFDQNVANKFSKLGQLILICGRYEGVDERVAKHIADMELSIGDYVLTGGELPAMVVVDAVARLVPEVIKQESLAEESFSLKSKIYNLESNLEYPQYTRPEAFNPKKGICWKVPKILLSGNHKKIEEWREKHKKQIKT